MPKYEEALAMAGINNAGRFIPDSKVSITCSCGRTQTLDEADHAGAITTRYLCASCRTEIMRVELLGDGSTTFESQFDTHIRVDAPGTDATG